MWSGNPNEALLAEAGDLPPGLVLDVGCGEGADSVWLAAHGWQVTALDVSGKAVERTVAAVSEAGLHVRGVTSALEDAPLAAASFDLVSAMYPALPRTPEHVAEHRLLDLVAPGGTLLVVHHADVGSQHGHDPEAYLSPEDVLRVAEDAGGWRVVVHEQRPRRAITGAGAHHRDDTVVRLQRL